MRLNRLQETVICRTRPGARSQAALSGSNPKAPGFAGDLYRCPRSAQSSRSSIEKELSFTHHPSRRRSWPLALEILHRPRSERCGGIPISICTWSRLMVITCARDFPQQLPSPLPDISAQHRYFVTHRYAPQGQVSAMLVPSSFGIRSTPRSPKTAFHGERPVLFSVGLPMIRTILRRLAEDAPTSLAGQLKKSARRPFCRHCKRLGRIPSPAAAAWRAGVLPRVNIRRLHSDERQRPPAAA